MDKKEVQSVVESFRQKTAYGNSAADCFPPWYLHQRYQISETKAMEQSSESSTDEGGVRGYDFGIDAFHLDGHEPTPIRLIIIQAKYSDSLSYISKGFKDLEKCLPQIQKVLESVSSDEPIKNKVIVNLRAALNRVDSEVRKKLNIEFIVIHLCDEDHAIISNRTREARERLKENVEDSFSDRTCTIKDIGPCDMGLRQEVIAPSPWTSLTFNAVPSEVRVQDQAIMHYGVGRLAELVELYTSRRDALFSKNVRYFLNSKKNIEKGAAGKMRETLNQICIKEDLKPETFALYHNGVTIFVRDVELTDGGVKIRDPYVLNGCQTIKNAYLFRYTQRNKDKIREDKWKHILVPLRILRTKKEDLVRQVTITNNRQNAITPSALRANDPIQIQLEERFRRVKIFYERQEGAYTALEDASPELLEDEYANTRGRQVNIVDLARSIAAVAGEREISLAQHPSDIFEGDAAYNRCFSEKRLASLTFLTFLQNLHDVIFVVLKKDLGLIQEGKGPKPGNLGYYAMCLLVRYMVKEKKHETIREFGGALWGRKEQFRTEITSMLDNYHSGIKGALKEKFLSLEDSKAESLKDAFKRTESSLRLRDYIDVFEILKNLDDTQDGKRGVGIYRKAVA